MKIFRGLVCPMSIILAAACSGSPQPSSPQKSQPPLPPLLFVRGNDNLLALMPNGSIRQVTKGDAAVWTPDHQKIVVRRSDYNSTPEVAVDFWLVGADGSEKGRLTTLGPEQPLSFAIDRKQPPSVAFTTDHEIREMKADGSGAHVVSEVDAGALAISPDGRQLAYAIPGVTTAAPTLVTVGINGSQRKVVYKGAVNTCNIGAVKWSPDGQFLAFTLCVNKGGNDSESVDEEMSVWVMRTDGSSRRLVAKSVDLEDLAWSPDGQWLVFSRPSGRGLFKAHIDGTGEVRITTGDDGSPAW
ncbi:PD40 domain-containing protein [Actinomadura graeca]|uniref:PD40 domain-containing protein n=1 Tax=Actinomadura graeca TaxID=2750812 RepID=A0ABX8QZ83_9ACTN|nr:hypothetical protein [Actinomadura graeca]QXJ24062.1 PD40 domain-containing protein [Actinomadura graeca]